MTEFTTTGNTCIHCGVSLVSEKRWARHAAEERAWGRAHGYGRAAGAHICHTCLKRGLTAPHVTYTLDETLHEWRLLADMELSIRENCRRIAPRMGRKWQSLERAITRWRKDDRDYALAAAHTFLQDTP